MTCLEDVITAQKSTNNILTGNGNPRKGLVFKVEILTWITIANLLINTPDALTFFARLLNH